MIDEKTLDNYFAQRKRSVDYIQRLENQIRHAEETRQSHDQNLHSAAAEYILDILADPTNQERYDRSFMDYKEIKERILELDARFKAEDIWKGLNDLLRAEPPKIVSEILTHRMAGMRTFTSIIYKLMEDTK